jgi:hypothetical protein
MLLVYETGNYSSLVAFEIMFGSGPNFFRTKSSCGVDRRRSLIVPDHLLSAHDQRRTNNDCITSSS